MNWPSLTEALGDPRHGHQKPKMETNERIAPGGNCKQSRSGQKWQEPIRSQAIPVGNAQASPLDILSLVGVSLGSWNIRGLGSASSGKVEALVHWAGEKGLGVLGLQEVYVQGIYERTVTDNWGKTWTLCCGGPPAGPRRNGTGFLISPEFEVVSYTAISSRVSWIQVRCQKGLIEGRLKRVISQTDTACFVCVYAPTETKSSEEELEDFYTDVKQALTQARESGGRVGVPVVGDFNLNLGSEVGMLGVQAHDGVLGNCLRQGLSSSNSGRFLAFCIEERLLVIQTFESQASLPDPSQWSTWKHPRTGEPHMKDFVLIPKGEKASIKYCRPHWEADILSADHSLVVCKTNLSRTHVKGLRWKLASYTVKTDRQLPQRRRGSTLDRRVQRVDIAKSQDEAVVSRFRAVLERKLEGLDAGWCSTEQVLKEVAAETIPALREMTVDSWATPVAVKEMRACLRQVSEIATLLSRKSPGDVSQLLARKRIAKKAYKLCVKKHKRAYQQRLLTGITRGRDFAAKRLALKRLIGEDPSAGVKASRRQVEPNCFAKHLNSLFSKKSAKEVLGLTAERVGQKSAPRMELSGPPTLVEVRQAITRMKRNTAPGANRLRSEFFKMGGDILAERLRQDFEVLWPEVPDPAPEEGVARGPTETQAPLRGHSAASRGKVFQTWQDATVVALFKGKGARADPNSYRGIFLLDVAGKIFASIIERRLREAAEGWLGDYQNGFRAKRSTSHAIHILRRVQEACRVQHVKAYAVFVDFAKAFDSPPRGAMFECLEWIGVPADLLLLVAAIHENPKGKVIGGDAWFSVERGVRQGCVLGPTMFIVLLEFCIRMADFSNLGLPFRCVDKHKLCLPADLRGATFLAGLGGFADDLVLIDGSPEALNAALSRLSRVCGSIGLDISTGKTEWIYLHHPDLKALNDCQAERSKVGHCCDIISLEGKTIKHVASFCYLGSQFCENGGVRRDTRVRIARASAALAKYREIWKSNLTVRQKIRFLTTYVTPILLYGFECGSHMQSELSQITRFQRRCQRAILCVGRHTARGRAMTIQILQRKCKLKTALDLLSLRRVHFVTQMIAKPACIMARQLIWGEIVTPVEARTGRTPGRQSPYLHVLDTDVQYLSSGTDHPLRKGLMDLVKVAHSAGGPPDARRLLKALKPDRLRGGALRDVHARERPFTCPSADDRQIVDCGRQFSERKALYRHIRTFHPNDARRLLASSQAGNGRVPQRDASPLTGRNGRMLPVVRVPT